MMTRTRIVAVSYLNTIPYIYGITRAGDSLREGLLLCPPRLCAEALRTGEANVGLIPVAAIPEIPDLQIITPFCIGASGPVRTVVLASDYPVEELDTIWLDSHSRTSVRLARILAAEKWGIAPQWRPLTDYSFGTGAAAGTHGTIPAAEATGTGGAAGTGTGTESGTGKSGYILIGDKVFDHEARFRYLYDLSDEWRAMTGLPFAFAAWVARGEVPQERVSQLEEALRYGTAHIPEAVAWSGYAARPYACDYLIRNIDFVLDAPKRWNYTGNSDGGTTPRPPPAEAPWGAEAVSRQIWRTGCRSGER